MDTRCQTAGRRRSDECKNVGAVSSFEGKNVVWLTSNKNPLGAVTCMMCLYTLFCELYDIRYMKRFME